MAVDEDELGSDVDPEEERMFDEGFTRIKVRTDESSCSIVIPLDCNLLTNMETVVPSFLWY